MKIHVAIITHRHGDDVIASVDEGIVTEGIVDYCKEWWEDQCEDAEMPDDAQELIEAYFDSQTGTEEFVSQIEIEDTCPRAKQMDAAPLLMAACEAAEGYLTTLPQDQTIEEVLKAIRQALRKANGKKKEKP